MGTKFQNGEILKEIGRPVNSQQIDISYNNLSGSIKKKLVGWKVCPFWISAGILYKGWCLRATPTLRHFGVKRQNGAGNYLHSRQNGAGNYLQRCTISLLHFGVVNSAAPNLAQHCSLGAGFFYFNFILHFALVKFVVPHMSIFIFFCNENV
ncbi:Uncharacterized protein Fot_15124 [Forsythia ovata]|uniref:Uncharacterized protein n=1 Tax=Forsythia ovata TaxID=205694 RepID=A0ABD1W891_9LAMI